MAANGQTETGAGRTGERRIIRDMTMDERDHLMAYLVQMGYGVVPIEEAGRAWPYGVVVRGVMGVA